MPTRTCAAIALTLASILVLAAAACTDPPARRGETGDRILDVPDGGAEPTVPVMGLPSPPEGPATATISWTEGRTANEAVLDDLPSSCRLTPLDGGSLLVVDIGDPATAGVARSADHLHLEVGRVAQTANAGTTVPDADGYLAEVQRLDLVVSGASPPPGGQAVGTLAVVDADLGSLRLPLGSGSVEITCGA